ncbi:helix-turn-helix domain-containing protein [uncultured Clostridium sp.]|uniref:helix-turn-helix domain-containing protein n=1 Tax=uncultured Clostridium sp. TaxID=59620 RepID=UPI0026159E42|nr:helix-turn-helix domain-containing protein [uncultured Clostridium sp.]
MNKLVGVRWGDLKEETREFLLENSNIWEEIKEGECIVDLRTNLSVIGEVVDNGEEKEIVIDDEAIIYNPEEGTILEAKKINFEINDVMTVSEAATIFGKTEGAIRAAIKAKKFIPFVDYRKAGGSTLITKEAMKRVYGELEED